MQSTSETTSGDVKNDNQFQSFTIETFCPKVWLISLALDKQNLLYHLMRISRVLSLNKETFKINGTRISSCDVVCISLSVE